jgi:hypothetical protein
MTHNINRLSKDYIDDMMGADPDCTSIKKTKYGSEVSLFEHCDDMKIIIGWLQTKGLDVFKRGTKEPERIKLALIGMKWIDIKDAAPAKNVITFADKF